MLQFARIRGGFPDNGHVRPDPTLISAILASTVDWLSGKAPRQFVHPEKRAALEQAGRVADKTRWWNSKVEVIFADVRDSRQQHRELVLRIED